MTKEQDVVLELIRKVVNTYYQVRIPLSVDWAMVIEVATEQGVLGICFDSVEQLPSDRRPDIDNLMEWLGQVEYQKTEYYHRIDVAKELAEEWHKEGIRTSVLKGIAYARYYKKPALRYSCDFDCYLTDWEKGNKIAEQLGASVDRSEQKHSHIQYKNVHIENHRECTGISEEGLEKYLSSMLFVSSNDGIDDTYLGFPPLTFDALFCLYHAQTHFVVEDGIQLRHVVDWVLIRRKLHEAGLYESCISDCEKYGLWRFTEVLNSLADVVEGKSNFENLSEREIKMWDDIWKPLPNVEVRHTFPRLNILFTIMRNSWKYKLYTESSSCREICKYLIRFAKRHSSNDNR